MDEQRREGHEVSFATWAKVRELRAADEVWIHCGWLPCLWWAALVCCLTQRRVTAPCGWARPMGKRPSRAKRVPRGAECAERILKWMPEACYDPVRLKYHGWKKWLVGPIERWCLRRCDRIVATCEAEKEWIEKYLGKRCPVVEVTDVKRFFELGREFGSDGKIDAWRRGFQPRQLGDQNANSEATLTRLEAASPNEGTDGAKLLTRLEAASPKGERDSLHILYLGRRHPLKGVEYLEKAVAELNSNPVNPVNPVQNSSTRSTCSTRLNKENSSLHVSTRSTRLNKENSSLHVSTRSTRLKIVSSAFGEELEKVWDWCDVLVLPTLSDNFGLVIAEALERGKRVITTDGAPAWEGGLSRVERVEGLTQRRVTAPCGWARPMGKRPSRAKRVPRDAEYAEMFSRVERVERVEGELWSGYEGRLIYLKGYREGTKEQRIELLRRAIELMSVGEMMAVS